MKALKGTFPVYKLENNLVRSGGVLGLLTATDITT